MWSAPFEIRMGATVESLALAARFEGLGYERVHRRPRVAGEYFWGHERFWFYQRPWRAAGEDHDSQLVGLSVDQESGRLLGLLDAHGAARPERTWTLEPQLLAESLEEDRAPRIRVSIKQLPDHVWQAVLAAEDHRFFEHGGVDARSVARALVTNVKAGGVRQGGSTITQQLIKNRDLTPRRTLRRKMSEAARALNLEAHHDKQDILEAYLNTVYLGHLEGRAIHGLGTASRAYFSCEAADLDLSQAALLAGVIRSPNRLAPTRHPEASRERRDVVLGRMEELGWIDADTARRAKSRPVRTRPTPPPAGRAKDLLAWVAELAREETPRRIDKGRGVVAETTLDAWLQTFAEEAIARFRSGLGQRSSRPELALSVLDSRDGSVLAHVGGSSASQFDRARQARRQPGSAIKPLLLVEAFEDCGPRRPVHTATRILDEPLTIELPTGPWSPRNADRRFRGPVSVREALTQSLNVPFARLVRWCGFEETAQRLRRLGLDVPRPAPPSFVLGAVETSPLDLASAYTVFATPGRRLAPRPVARWERPGGRRLGRHDPSDRRVSSAAAAWLVKDLLRSAVEEGTAHSAESNERAVWAKTGTSSDRRDAWMAGLAGSTVVVLWAGHDDGGSLDFGGSRLGPLWREIADVSATLRPAQDSGPPDGIVERWVDPESGLLVRSWSKGARREVFKRGTVPRRDRFWRSDAPEDVIR